MNNESTVFSSNGAYNVQANLQATKAVIVTKSDTTVLAPCTLFIGTAGNVTVDTVGGQIDVLFKNLPNGSILPVLVVKVKAATTAADIIAIS